MTEKTIKVPGPDHPITVEPAKARVVVTVAGQVIADTRNALVLREASYPAVYYIPRNDVEMTLLERTDHTTYCPYKGDCAYYSMPIGGERTVNAVWTYESPYAAVKEIAQHLAFYPDRVDSIDVQARCAERRLSAHRSERELQCAALHPNDSARMEACEVRQEGLEPPTLGLEGRCSIQLSYCRIEVRRCTRTQRASPAMRTRCRLLRTRAA